MRWAADMSKVYGGRWKIVDGNRLGDGGQSEVFRVVDTRAEHHGQFALKRVRNSTRHARFRHEIEAIKRLAHPNIIKLIDHSVLDDTDDCPEEQFLVMPIAEGGDLSAPGRRILYKDTIDGALQVAKQVATALGVAHATGVIHRDVKPQNILFTGVGHEIWLTDFGICLLPEQLRVTEAQEAVGPRAFMAPELEDGGRLEVTPAVDIYSLGKVIYYMVTGGTVLPRERMHEESFRKVFLKGEQYGLLELLLAKMICQVTSRMQDMKDVIRELDKIPKASIIGSSTCSS
jgi:serine/threonine protein kinase